MEHMVSMMRKPAKGPKTVGPADAPSFPHSLYLDGDDIKKMGMSDAEMGEERMMMAKVRVASMSASKGAEGEHRSMSVEFMEGAMEKMGKKPAADRIYGGKHGGGK